MKYDYPVEVGRKFGHLTVVETGLKQELKKNPGHFQTVAKCVCDCGSGKEVLVVPSLLRNGLVSSCGCLLGSKVKIGARSGELEVLKCGYKKVVHGNQQFMVMCKCHRCGGEKELLETVFRNKKPQNCGCIHRQTIVVGSRQGKLEVIGEAGQDANFNHLLKCRCDCGKEFVMTISRWNKHPTSCGCDRVEKGRVDREGIYHVYKAIENGSRFGHLEVIDGTIVKGAVRYARCKCDCGNEVTIPQPLLRNGNRTSCGCHGFVSVKVGDVFDRLTVVEIIEEKNSERTTEECYRAKHKARCVCSCGSGKEMIVTQSDLKAGKVRSCGCLLREKSVTHGCSHDRLYRIWVGMKDRCTSRKRMYSKWYVDRGITYAPEWNDFLVFREWALSHGYAANLTLDRIDSNGNYSPTNCRWATRAEQSNNKRDNVRLTYNGETMTIAEWANRLGVNDSLIRGRIRAGWTVEETLTTPGGMTRGWRNYDLVEE